MAPKDPTFVRSTCRACATPLTPILDLGPTYLSDFPRSAGSKAHPPVPLTLVRCPAPTCGLVQLLHTTPKEWLFTTYWYRSGVNEAMVAELQHLVADASRRVDLPKAATVVDIGANDGTLLAQYPPGLLTVAWEPAANLYEVLRPHAKVLFPEYFTIGEPWAMAQRARIVTAVAMFYDLDDPHAFLDNITKILHPEGVFVVQQAYLPSMLTAAAFDNICHEHLEYYDLAAMEAVLAPHGLEVVDVELRRINGGSFRTTIQFKGLGTVTPAVEQVRALEAQYFEHREEAFETFAQRVQTVKTQLAATLGAYQETGGAVDLLGASTKGNTLLQYCGIDARMIRQAWERSPEKWGRYVGVSGIPIVSEAEGRQDPPAALLSTIWQFKEALVKRESGYLAQGGRIIFPLPRVESVEAQL